MTRSRHCFRDFDHGNLSNPAAIKPAAKIFAVSADGDSAIGASDSVIACRLFLRRARKPIAPRSNEISSAVLDLVGEAQFDLFLRDRRRQQNAPLRGRAGQFGDRDIGRARQRRGLFHGRAAAIGEHKTAIAAVARDAVGEGKGQHDAGAQIAVRLRGRRSGASAATCEAQRCARLRALDARGERSRRN